MRYQERIYIQTAHSCVRNKIINIVSMSSDICEFNEPSFGMSGASKIMTGTTISDNNIHIVDTGTTFDLSFTFTGNVETFIDTDTNFKYDIYSYNNASSTFTTPLIFSSGEIGWDTFSGTSAFTDTLLFSEFVVDGEYLVKGSYDFTSCTEYLSALGDVNNTSMVIGTQYGLYDPIFDSYFALINKATKPVFTLSPTDSTRLGSLIVESVNVTTETTITTKGTWLGSPIVALNGITLAEGKIKDFITVNNTIYFNSPLVTTDIVTVAYVGSGAANGLVSESLIVEDPIVSGTTDGEGSNQYYYNTDTSKFEVYMLTEPVEFNDVIFTLNGVTLANVADYSQSSVNPKKITLNGIILDSDVITLTYNSYGTFVGTIYTDNFDVFWTVSPPPTNVSGFFTAIAAEDESFSGGTIIYSATTPYVTNNNSYSSKLDVSSYTGTTLFYKIINQKDYNLIIGEIITTTTDSDIIPITLSL
jgi:hypothetical protein